MTVIGEQMLYTKAIVGQVTSKNYSALAAETKPLFTVTGLVCVSTFIGVVTTAMTVTNTVKITADPTVGVTTDMCIATDLGTTDTPAGNILAIPSTLGSAMINAIGVGLPGRLQWYMNAGTIQQITTGTNPDGAITWYCGWCPITDGASVAAA